MYYLYYTITRAEDTSPSSLRGMKTVTTCAAKARHPVSYIADKGDKRDSD